MNIFTIEERTLYLKLILFVHFKQIKKRHRTHLTPGNVIYLRNCFFTGFSTGTSLGLRLLKCVLLP